MFMYTVYYALLLLRIYNTLVNVNLKKIKLTLINHPDSQCATKYLLLKCYDLLQSRNILHPEMKYSLNPLFHYLGKRSICSQLRIFLCLSCCLGM